LRAKGLQISTLNPLTLAVYADYVTFILIVLAAEVCSGMFGLGGNVVIVPALLLATAMDVGEELASWRSYHPSVCGV